MNIKDGRYNAEREIEFIDGLGTFGVAEKNGENLKTRKELLRNYLIAAKKRSDDASFQCLAVASVMDSVRQDKPDFISGHQH